jgi:hypothetical protein
MHLALLLDRCRRCEERAAALYRRFAAAPEADSELRELWAALAADEEEHAHSLVEAPATSVTWLEGWQDALTDVERTLEAAERLGPRAKAAERLGAALALELTELDALRAAVLGASGRLRPVPEHHADRLARTALRLSDDAHVRTQALVLLARSRLEHAAG